MKKFLFLLTGLMFMLASCGGEEGTPNEPAPKPTPTPEETASITMNTTIPSGGLAFDVNGGEKSVSFTTNKDWTVSVAATTGGATWCTASPTSGSQGNATVKFTVKENTDYDDRSVSVTIKAGTATKTFTINQKGADALLVTTDKYEVAQEGGEIEVEVQANIDYEMEISETAKDWITEATTRALTTHKHAFTIAANEELEKREGEIIFKSGDKVETVKVYQAGSDPVLVLSQNQFNVSDAGEVISIDVKSNIDFGVQMPDVDWIKDEAATRGMSSHTLKYDILPNETYDAREAEIIFYDKNSDLKETVKILQAQKDAIIISNKNYEVEAEGETIEIKLSANVDFDVTMPDVDWITQVTTRGLTEHTLLYKVAENTGEDSRSAEIVFTNKESRLSEKITIVQKYKSVLTLDKEECTVSDACETISIQVKSNVEYEIQMPDVDWITKETSTRAASTEMVKFVIAQNETYDGREAEILFKDKNSNLSATLKITQAQKDAIILSQKEINVKSEGETIEVKLSANVDFDVTMPDVDWITQVTTRGLTEHTLYYKVAENTGEDSRSAEIEFINKDTQLRETIQITQNGSGSYVDGVVTVTEAGTVSSLLGDDYLNITSLKVVGPINGDDVIILRQMAGYEKGKLTTLDLSEALIVKGGSYYYSYDTSYWSTTYLYTTPNVIGPLMFAFCDNLHNIILPNSVIRIGGSAFEDCDALTSITIPDNVTEIGESAFEDCDALTSITIPDNVTEIGGFAFYKCDALTSITIPDNVTEIGEFAFKDCDALSAVTIGNSVIRIGGSAFENCDALTSITIPDNVTEIGGSAFYGCTSLTSVKIGNGVTSILSGVFAYCKSLSSVTIGKGVTSIASESFEYCDAIKAVCIWDISAWCKIDFDDGERGRKFNNLLSSGAKLYLNDNEVTDLVIPDDIVEIKQNAFAGCSSLTSVTISDNVISIGESAFSDCHALTSVTLGDGVTSIGRNAFDRCFDLTSITIPNNVTTIGVSAFEFCTSLSSVTISNGVIGDAAFNYCTSLTSVTLGDGVTYIGKGSFTYCEALTSITIPDNVTTIGERAFSECGALTSVTIGKRVKTIRAYAFYNSSLIECYCYATSPPSLQCSDPMGTKWDNFPPKGKRSTLYVPAGCSSEYKSKYGHWKDFFTNIIEMDE